MDSWILWIGVLVDEGESAFILGISLFFFSGRFSRPMNRLNFSPFRDRYCLIEKAVKKKKEAGIFLSLID